MFAAKALQTIRLGIKSLLLHKLRSALAVLGILIGVTAVIWLVAMGEGVSYQAQQQIKDLGATNIIVRSMKPTMSSSAAAAGSFFIEYGLKRDDFDRLSKLPTVVDAAPLRELSQKEARYLDRSLDVRIVGCRNEYLDLNHLTLAAGRFLTAEDEANIANVCVLASQAARTLFRHEDPVGSAIYLDGEFYVVVGVTNERSASGNIGGSFTGQDYNKDVYIPLRTLRARIGDMVMTARAGGREGEIVQLNQITVTVRDMADVDETSNIIRNLLERYHKNGDFALIVPKELLKQAEVTRLMFNVLLVLIAGIALLVGGIGIMNIMLATVTERTREIGIRRALGAKRRDIVSQFLAETLVLSGTGGALGVLCGFSVPLVVAGARQLMNQFFPAAMAALPPNIRDLTPLVAPWSVVAAFVISMLVGIVFGLYPARRASLMDPIEALRHE
jgi:putative ABC transport system permease protein